jgi:hypothetical protein
MVTSFSGLHDNELNQKNDAKMTLRGRQYQGVAEAGATGGI